MSSAPFPFYEFFAGGGMARQGLGEAWKCLFANDFDHLKARAYQQNFLDAPAHFHEGDVWKLATKNLPGRAMLAWASSPCQDFSLAGSRAGLKGGRSSAFFGFWQLMEALDDEGRMPRIIVVENVVGLLTSHGGADFEALCRAFVKRGYKVGALELDAARFVPQSRPRLFMVAVRGTLPESLSQIDPTPPFHSRRIQSVHAALPKSLRRSWVWWSLPYPPTSNAKLDSVLDRDAAVDWFSEERTARLRGLLGEKHAEKLADAQTRTTRSVGTIFRRMRVEAGKKVQRAELRFDGVAGCLRTPGGGSSKQFVVVVERHKVRARDLTVAEAARLMGLSDSYEFPKGKTAALKIIGDGVVVPVVKFLSENLLLPLASHCEVQGCAEESRQHVALTG